MRHQSDGEVGVGGTHRAGGVAPARSVLVDLQRINIRVRSGEANKEPADETQVVHLSILGSFDVADGLALPG